MDHILARFPVEVLGLVIERLERKDLKALSQTSRWMHTAVASTIWRSITIKPESEFQLHLLPATALPQIYLQHVKQLQFQSGHRFANLHLCPHNPYNVFSIGASYGLGLSDDKYHSNFMNLASCVKLFLDKLEEGQLHSFSWDLRSCIPTGILDTDGIIPRKQSQIQSLSITDPKCLHRRGASSLDLSAFHQLRHLIWKSPTHDDLPAIAVGIRNNAAHLLRLELGFEILETFRRRAELPANADDLRNIRAQRFSINEVLRWDVLSPLPLLLSIRKLSLSQVLVDAGLARAINFETLQSLTLRKCPGWDSFLRSIIKLQLPVRLKSFEFHQSIWWGKGVLKDFLDAFEGLEELFISQTGIFDTLDHWSCIARHHTTLKRLVHEQRIVVMDGGSLMIDEQGDLTDMDIFGAERDSIKADPSKNPLGKLDLEFIAINCMPEYLKDILLPFTGKTSLKVLHIRQSCIDLGCYTSRAVEAVELESRHEFPAAGVTQLPGTNMAYNLDPDAAEIDALRDELGCKRKLRVELREFAEWVFGPQGIPSLQIMVFGDFSYGGRMPDNNFIFYRSTEDGRPFRHVSKRGPEWVEVIDGLRKRYPNALDACPVASLFGD